MFVIALKYGADFDKPDNSSFFSKTRANTQQVLPEQTGLYRYDE